MFVRHESFSAFLRNYPVTSSLIAINLLVFLLIHLLPAPVGGEIGFLFQKMVGWNGGIAEGEYWRLITPIFLHFGVAHVLFNSFSLVLFAPALERILGKIKFLIAYLGSGVIANIATFWLEPPSYLYLGASGAVFGLFGIYVYMVLFRKDLMDAASAQIVITILVISLIMTFIGSNINILGHLFGLIGGLLLAPPLLAGIPLYYSWQPQVAPRRTKGTFDPNRWQKKRRNRRLVRMGLWTVFAVLILLGLLSSLL